METKGHVHSFESFGTKDGPGIRFVLFMQGCPLRCLYCHNTDTWSTSSRNKTLSPQEAFNEVAKVKGFIRSGGVTVSGGEPLLQPDFVLELFKLCKEANIHTALDTSGFILNDKTKLVLEQTDLVLLDIKHIDPVKYKTLTSVSLDNTLRFIAYLETINKPAWIRYVVVPGYSDDEADLHQWAKFVSQFKIVERVDILPFHQMGTNKWEELGKKYQLKDTPTPTPESIKMVENIFLSYGLPIVK